jgi:hypothetical protein
MAITQIGATKQAPVQEHPSSVPPFVGMAVVALGSTGFGIIGLACGIGGLSLPIAVDGPALDSLVAAALFVAAIVAFALRLATTVQTSEPKAPQPKAIPTESGGQARLDFNGLLLREFEYARETAAQAMEERRTVINFYLLIVGGAGSGVIALLGAANKQTGSLLGAALLWLVTVMGGFTLFQLIALRIAWVGSANAMNHIKDFYVVNAELVPSDVLQTALLWQPTTLPPPYKHWNVSHYSAVVVAFLGAASFAGGALLLSFARHGTVTPVLAAGTGVLALGLFMAFGWAYDLSLTYRRKPRG